MLDWVKSWSRVTWAMAVGLGIGVLLTLNYVFGADTLRAWVEAIWGSSHG